MLNLHSLQPSVNSPLIPNPNNPAGASIAYRQLKDLGWTCYGPADRDGLEIHPADHVPVFRLGCASIRRNITMRSFWVLEIGGESRETSGSVQDITTQVNAASLRAAMAEHGVIHCEWQKAGR